MLDTGHNKAERKETLLYQQRQLVEGTRDVQMFPAKTRELPLPDGMVRIENARGVFHFNPNKIAKEHILTLSSFGCENEFLNLGPYNKSAIEKRVQKGEKPIVITEYTAGGIEVRTAVGTEDTLNEQLDYFNSTKHRSNRIAVDFGQDGVLNIIKHRLTEMKGV